MQRIETKFADYASYHRTAGNKAMHRAGIPLIVFSLLGLLAAIPIGRIAGVALDAAMILIVVSEIYYLALEWKLGIAMLLITVPMYVAAHMLALWALWALFILGWILQFVGHGVYEKKKPAFAQNLTHLLIGPLWILNDVVPVVQPVDGELTPR